MATVHCSKLWIDALVPMRGQPMHLSGTPTLNKHVLRASVSVVPEGIIDESAALREGCSFMDGTQLLAETLEKTIVSSAIDKNGARIRCLIFLVALPLLVFGDFPARRLTEPRPCLLLGQDDAPAKGNLDQLRKLAIEPFGLQGLEFLAVLRRGDPAVLLGI